jgi:hypothetical protein
VTIKVKQPQIVTVTKQLARRYLHDNQYDRQRGLNLDRVDQYHRDILNGDWLPGTMLGFARFDGKTYLYNGQHSLEAIIRAGQVQEGISVEMIRVDMEVDTFQELAALYYNTDMGLPRSIGQMYRSLGLGDEMGVPEYLARRAGNAINFIHAGWIYSKRAGMTKNEVLSELTTNYRQPLNHYRALITARPGGLYSKLWRASVSSLGLETLRYNPEGDGFERVKEFWEGVVMGENLRPGDPRGYARDHILTTTMGDEKNAERTTPGYQARYLAACWNAHYQGELFSKSRTGVIRIQDSTSPICILGTPWDGTKTK